MSLNFKGKGALIWNPSERTGRIFLAYSKSLEPLIGRSSGIEEVIEGDTYEVDGKAVEEFAREIADWYFSTNHPIVRSMLEGVLRTCMVLSERCGSPVDLTGGDILERTIDDRVRFVHELESGDWPMPR